MIGLDVIRYNFQFAFLLIIWVFAGIYTGPGVFLIIPVSLFLLFANDRLPELLIGFIFILVLSDSLEAPMLFAKSFKNIYLLMMTFFLFVSLSKQTQIISLYKLFIPFLVFCLIGLIYSPVPAVAFQKLVSYTLLFIAVPNYVYLAYTKQGPEFFRNLIYFLVAIVVIGFLFRFYNAKVAYSHGGRLRGIFGNPNGLGIFLILFFIIFSIVNNKFKDLFTRWEVIIIGLVMFYFLIKTGSRTALLAILLFYLFNQIFKYSNFLGFLLFAIIMVSIELVVVNLPKIIVALNLQETFRIKTLEEGSGRTVAWDFAWKNIEQSLFIGKGMGFDEDLMRTNRAVLSREGHQGGVHNTYLIIWLNAGLLGLLAFLRGFIYLFIKGAKNSSYAFPAMFTIMLSINFEPWLAASLNPYTILFLIVATLLTEDIFNSEEEENEEELESIAQVA